MQPLQLLPQQPTQQNPSRVHQTLNAANAMTFANTHEDLFLADPNATLTITDTRGLSRHYIRRLQSTGRVHLAPLAARQLSPSVWVRVARTLSMAARASLRPLAVAASRSFATIRTVVFRNIQVTCATVQHIRTLIALHPVTTLEILLAIAAWVVKTTPLLAGQ